MGDLQRPQSVFVRKASEGLGLRLLLPSTVEQLEAPSHHGAFSRTAGVHPDQFNNGRDDGKKLSDQQSALLRHTEGGWGGRRSERGKRRAVSAFVTSRF